jgi:hypothetical protein
MIKYLSLITLAITWLISIFASRATFGTLRDFTTHEWLSYHTLISMRAFEQWGFWQLLGVSVVASKSYEWQDYDIRNLWKGDGLYLSYPSLWLDIPYLIFKAVGWEVSIPNLHIYSLVVNRFLCSIIIFLLYRELSKLILNKFSSQPDYDAKVTIPALIGTVAWLLNPSVLYWTQNVYFTDQAVVLPVCSIFWLTTKSDFKLHNLSGWQKALLFFLTLVATGYDWYAWTFLFCLLLVYFLISIDIAPIERIKAVVPILSAWLLVAVSFLCQLIYFRDGIPQIIATLKERSFINESDNKLENFWQVFGRHLLDCMPSRRSVIIIILLIVLAIGSLLWIIKNFGSWNLFVVLLLLLATPLLHNLLLANHSYIHNFSAFKLSVGIIFCYSVIPFMVLVVWLEKAKFQLLLTSLISLMLFGIFVSPNLLLKFSLYLSSTNFSEQFGNLVTAEIKDNQVPFSRTLYIPAFPPERLWYANRRIYDYKYVKGVIEGFGLQNKPVEYVFVERENDPSLAEVCSTTTPIKLKSLLITLGSGETVSEEIAICKIDLKRFS